MSNIFHTRIDNKSYFVQFLYLLLFFFACFSFFSILSAGLAAILGFSLEMMQNMDIASLTDRDLSILKLMQIVSTIGIFITPALLFSFYKTGTFTGYFESAKSTKFPPALWAIGITVTALPLVAFLMEINQGLSLPAFMEGIEQWMRESEDHAKELTAAFLQMETPIDLLFNLIMVAVLPAIGEELFFRGTLQKFIREWTTKPHFAIFITAFFFSFIHFQFYGFFPRMLIGLFLGYLFYWSGNIWYPIIAHFVNNGLQVFLVYLHKVDLMATDIEQVETVPLPAVLVGTCLLAACTYFYYQSVRGEISRG